MLRPRSAPIPSPREETIRQRISELLVNDPLTARDISGLVSIPEKEVADHLAHLHHSLQHSGSELRVIPAECLGCGYVFAKRERFTRPGRCPVCHQTHIQEPLFVIAARQ